MVFRCQFVLLLLHLVLELHILSFHLVVTQQNLLIWLLWIINLSHMGISSLFTHFILESFIFRLFKFSVFLFIGFKWIVAKFLNLFVEHILSKLFVDFRISEFHRWFLRFLRTTVFFFNNFPDLRIVHSWEMSLNIIICTLVTQFYELIALSVTSFFESSWSSIVGYRRLLLNIRIINLRSDLKFDSLSLLIIGELKFGWCSDFNISVFNRLVVPVMRLLHLLRRLVHFNLSLWHFYLFCYEFFYYFKIKFSAFK